jgi:hypothetical protein
MAATLVVAKLLLTALNLVEAGFALRELVSKIHMMYAEGATDEQVHEYLKNLRDTKLKELHDAQ